MLKVGDKFINFDGTYLTGFISPVRNVTVLPNEGGSVNAFPTTVHEGTNVSLTNTINQSLTSEVHVLSMGITFGQCNFDRENTYSTVRLIKDN